MATSVRLSSPTAGTAGERRPGWVAYTLQAGWVVLATAALGIAVVATPSLFAILQTTCAAQACPLVAQLNPDSIELLQQVGIPVPVYAGAMVIVEWLFVLLVLTVASTIVWKQPRDSVGVALAYLLGVFCIDNFALALQQFHPDFTVLSQFTAFVKFAAGPAVFVRFPDGRWVPPWSRWLALAAPALAVVLVFFGEGAYGPFKVLCAAALWCCVFYAGIYRYRFDSDRIARQQIKWLVLAGGILIVTEALSIAAFLLDAVGSHQFLLVALVYGANTAVILSIAFPILRYRLFDIDIVINRALVYGGLTAIVVGVYVAIVDVLGRLLRSDDALISLLATSIIAVFFQPVRERLQRAANRLLYGDRDEPYTAISRLSQRLEVALAPGAILATIVDVVAGALRVPYAAIALDGDTGLAVAASTGDPMPNALRIPLSYQGEAVGELRLAPRAAGERFSAADRRLIDDLARQATVAAHATRLADESRRLAADLQVSRERLVLAREEERRRLRRDLHDGLGPRLAALTLRMETARDALAHDPLADELLSELAARTAEAVADVRRVVYALRPPALDDLGLVGALQQAVDNFASTETHVVVDVPERLPALPAAVEVAAFHIAQEALTNVLRHSSARTCGLQLTVDSAARELIVLVEDDGHGIAEHRASGVGLHSMRERASELGGRCEIEQRPGGGTRVCATLPIHSLQDSGDG